MTLQAPGRLWLLVAVLGAVAAYAVAGRRSRHHAVRHPDLDLLVAVAPRSGAWRRHLVLATMLAAVAVMVVGLARPARSDEVERREATVVLAIDVSGSMSATDVAPSRLRAAVAAAREFVSSAPEGYQIGLVSFDVAGHLLAAPTTDRSSVVAALGRLERGPGTAAGDGLLAALDAVEAARREDPAVVVDEVPDASIILLADGESTVGIPLDEAAARAADAGVAVHTVAYGTDQGVAEVAGRLQRVPADPAAMAAVADATGGQTYTATSGDELRQVYGQIASRMGTVEVDRDLTVVAAGAGALLMALAVVSASVWAPRLT